MYRPSTAFSSLGWIAAALLAGSSFVSRVTAATAAHQRQCAWGGHGFPFPSALQTTPLPVDGESADWAPWTHEPHCLQGALQPVGAPEWCVYTDTTFRGGRGLSVITHPSFAAALVGSLDDTVLAARGASPPPLRAKKHRNYVLKAFRGRGTGVAARRDLRRWETVMTDYPAMVLKGDFFDSDLGEEEQDELKRVALERLPAERQKEFLALAASHGVEKVEDILRTNVLGIEVAGETHLGLFPAHSRINHHCSPNTYWRFLPSTLTTEVVATKFIPKGDEVTHSYIPIALPKKDRQGALQRWNFNCTCSLCQLPEKKAWPSEVRRVRLHEVFQALHDHADITEQKVDDLVREMNIIIQAEGLQLQLCELSAAVARAYAAAGALGPAREHAALSEEYWIRYGTEEHENIEGVKELWRELAQAEKRSHMGPKPRSFYFSDEEFDYDG